jgi:Mn-containing catalase
VFSHARQLQFEARPDGPDAAFARRLQEMLGGKWGALTVAHQYLFQGWSCRRPGKYRDLLLDMGTEAMAHVEMICTMITRLLQDAPMSAREAIDVDGTPAPAVLGGLNPAHLINAGAGPLPMDSNGVPWSGSYVTSSGNLLADFHANVTAEAQARLQAARLFQMTDDPGVKRLLRFLLARNTKHQLVWLAAIEELKHDGLEEMPVPDGFPDDAREREVGAAYLAFSAGSEAINGGWAAVSSEAEDSALPTPGEPPELPPGDPRLYSTAPSSFTD